MTNISLMGSASRQVGLVENLDRLGGSGQGEQAPEVEMLKWDVTLAEANVVTSRDGLGWGQHYPVIDLDVPAMLIPSTTPGHSHLFIDTMLDELAYFDLLDAMAKARIVEPGYVGASRRRGHTAVRLPWHRKPQS